VLIPSLALLTTVLFQPATRQARAVVGGAVLLALAACKRSPAPTAATSSSAASASASAALPVDRLEAPGELAAGPEQAFGLPLPRSFTVKRFEDVVVARGQAAVEPVLTFVRRRASDPTVQRIGTRWVFPQTKVTGAFQPRTVRVEISQPAAQGVVEILVRDVTPAPPPSVPVPEVEQWRTTGLTPNGKLLDPDRSY